MPRKKKPDAIVRVEAELVSPQASAGKLEALLDRLVQERVAQALARRDDALFEPHFRSKAIADEIRRHQTVPEQKRWPKYFERWGCIACRRKRAAHAANGYCDRCRSRLVYRLKTIERELSKQYAERNGLKQIEQITQCVRSAERLLGKGESR